MQASYLLRCFLLFTSITVLPMETVRAEPLPFRGVKIEATVFDPEEPVEVKIGPNFGAETLLRPQLILRDNQILPGIVFEKDLFNQGSLNGRVYLEVEGVSQPETVVGVDTSISF